MVPSPWIYTALYTLVWHSKRMESNFTYTLVSDLDNGSQFYNSCNKLLDFQTHPYEVCVREIFFNTSAWDNVRVGGNEIIFKKVQYGNDFNCFVKPDKYNKHE